MSDEELGAKFADNSGGLLTQGQAEEAVRLCLGAPTEWTARRLMGMVEVKPS